MRTHLLETPRTSQHYCIKVFKRGPQCGPHFAEKRQPLRQQMQDFPVWGSGATRQNPFFITSERSESVRYTCYTVRTSYFGVLRRRNKRIPSVICVQYLSSELKYWTMFFLLRYYSNIYTWYIQCIRVDVINKYIFLT